MGPADQIQLICFEKVGNNVDSKEIADSAFAISPALHFFNGVRPQQVTEQPSLRNFCGPGNRQNLFNLREVGRQPTMHTNNLVLDNSTDGHGIEALRKYFPDLDAITPLAYIKLYLH